jgi:hypothetical protein
MVHPLDPDWEWREGGTARKKQAQKDVRKQEKQKKSQNLAAMRDASKNMMTWTNEEGDVIVPDGTEGCCNTATRSGSFSHGNNGCGCLG